MVVYQRLGFGDYTKETTLKKHCCNRTVKNDDVASGYGKVLLKKYEKT